MAEQHAPPGHKLTLVNAVRYGLPAVLVVIAFVVLFGAPDSSRYEGFSVFLGSALSIILLNILFRMGASGDSERHAEEAAREYYAEHGHWPDERPPER
jgi:hypothetical protein